MPSSEPRRRANARTTANLPAEAATAAAAGAAAGAQAGAEPESFTRAEFWNNVKQSVLRAVLLYASLRYFGLQSKPGANVPPDPRSLPLPNAWPDATPYELRVFSSQSSTMSFAEARTTTPDWAEHPLHYTQHSSNFRARNVTLRVPRSVVAHNSSWFAHLFVARTHVWNAAATHEIDERTLDASVLYKVSDLVTWVPVSAKTTQKHLLAAKESPLANPSSLAHMKSFQQMWRPQLSIVLLTHQDSLALAKLPKSLADDYRITSDKQRYVPPLLVNDFWLLSDMWKEMNASVESATVQMTFSPMALYKWSMYRQFEATWDKQLKYGQIQKGETDRVKRMLLETNPILLGTTMIVSVAHSVLEALAFRNDISHWNSIKSMEGISIRSMSWKIGMQIIIFLYLWDNDTSWMIIISNAIGIIIEIWKLCKAVDFKNFGKKRLFGVIPWFEMSNKESYSKKTKEYDDQAMRYLSYVMYPVTIAYSIYSLVFETHKSWYSWVLGSLVGTVYTFGFIMMFPQIFINYKLKSVAHLPMKAMMYKTLNTVIDDLFSFVIKMPWLHRLACFRDDIVFLIYLYQRWIYPVDNTRVNEFGQTFDENGKETTASANKTSKAVISPAEAKHREESDRVQSRAVCSSAELEQEKSGELKKKD